MNTHVSRLQYWMPRVLGVLFAGFLAMFALDVFDERLGFWQTVVTLAMHLIPAAIVLAAVLLGWFSDLAGAVIMVVFGLAYAIQFSNHLTWVLCIAGPAFVIGLLFFLSWLGTRRITQ
jgi:hypothetical protein